ncbi:MAG: hypothetical protein HY690_03045 [Chloroflexi bacterium]|nr:hypothetical protein [Chloroflexota bacterium]
MYKTSRPVARPLAALALAAGLVLLACQAGGAGSTPSPAPGATASTGTATATATPGRGNGTLVAQVQVAGRPGVAPAPGLPPPAPRAFGPGAGAVVRVVAPAMPGTVVSERVADASGEARFDLPPGRYWVFVPWSDQAPGLPGATPVGAHLPDGRPVLAWAEAEVQSVGTADVTLTIFVALV